MRITFDQAMLALKQLVAEGKIEPEQIKPSHHWTLPDGTSVLAAPAEIRAAQNIYGADSVQIDNDAMVSRTDDGGGVWVQAWVYLDEQDIEEAQAELNDEAITAQVERDAAD